MFKKVISFVTCSVITFALISNYPAGSGRNINKASAMTIAEMQEEINVNKAKISDLQTQLDALAGNKAEEQQYQSILNDQIDIIQENISLLNKELENINADIESTKNNRSGYRRSAGRDRQ